MSLELKSGSVSYFDQGHGWVVLLIHAFPLNRTMWEPQLAPLSAEFRVLAPDIRGFGGSQPACPWTMESMADE
ncbi:MAG TPA: alpha/beta fold hydrolase, partial [Terriglobia bacterium]|nr:alpha/beta fold hydrolase [Terriglobia bacterium]